VRSLTARSEDVKDNGDRTNVTLQALPALQVVWHDRPRVFQLAKGAMPAELRQDTLHQTSEAHLREGAYTCGRSPQCGGDTSSSESWESRAAGDIGHHGESIECSARYCAALSLAKSVRI